MTDQRWFIYLNKCNTLVGDTNIGCVGGGEGNLWEISVFYAKFCHGPELALKDKVCK